MLSSLQTFNVSLQVPMAAGKAAGSSSILATRIALPIYQLKNDFLRAVRGCGVGGSVMGVKV